jgi:lysophospholipase L1-like esterase
VTGGKLLSGYYSFVEDFKRDRVSTTKVRRAHFGNGWVVTAQGASNFLSKARFTADSNPVLNINADVDGDRFFLVTGGETENTGVKLREVMNLPPKEGRTLPEGLPLASAAAGSGRPADKHESAVDFLQGPWDPGVVHRESVLFLRGRDGRASAKLLYDVEKVLAVHRADGRESFEAERDYVIDPDRAGLSLSPDSRIAFLEESELFRPKGSPHSIGHRAGDPKTSVLFDNAHFFHDRQVEVSYVPRRPEWGEARPRFAGERLSHTLEKLRSKRPLTIAVSGDSISEGYNASEFTKVAPFQPPYPTLVASQLEKVYGSKVTLHNMAVGGWSSGQGVGQLEELLKRKPDLVILAYGMNDVGTRNPEAFKANLATMVRRIREASSATDVILVATMTGNPDWMATPAEMFPKYRDALAALEGPGVVLADLTAVWQRLLARKRHTDLTGNGVNHPNDFGHRVYAQAILALLVERNPRP